jgi:serpin B
MPRILAFGACRAVGLTLWVGFSFFHPATTTAAEPQKEASKVDVPAISKEAAYQALVTGNTTFALALYKHIAANQKGDVVLGPHSISQALALAEAGAAGKTKEEIDQVLGWKPLGEQLHPSWASLSTDLKKVTGVELAIANRLFLQKGAPFLDSYINLCRDHHGALPETCDFLKDPEQERVKINAWVSEQTKTRIPELIKPEPQVIKKDTRGVLVNACYFKGEFQLPFDARFTQKADFYATDGVVPCEMMQNTKAFDHWSDEKTDLIRLPYGEKEKPASAYLTLMVPKSKDGLSAMEKTLGANALSTAVSKATNKYVQLSMPRFTSRTPIDLKDSFKSLGVKRAFDENMADFSAMSRDPLYISAVIHEAWIATDESGSEAAAATAVVMTRKNGGGTPPTVTLHIDRPFFWFISDAKTGAMLFMGRVTKPQDPGPAKK